MACINITAWCSPAGGCCIAFAALWFGAAPERPVCQPRTTDATASVARCCLLQSSWIRAVFLLRAGCWGLVCLVATRTHCFMPTLFAGNWRCSQARRCVGPRACARCCKCMPPGEPRAGRSERPACLQLLTQAVAAGYIGAPTAAPCTRNASLMRACCTHNPPATHAAAPCEQPTLPCAHSTLSTRQPASLLAYLLLRPRPRLPPAPAHRPRLTRT